MKTLALVVLLLAAAQVAAAQPEFKIGFRRTYPVGTSPQHSALADFNRDGNLDLAVVNGTVDSVTVLLGDGRGNFGPPARYRTGTSPVQVAVGDLDGDGRLDLVTANQAGTVSLLRGRDGGTFGTKFDFAVGASPQWVAIGDVNGDSHPDVVAANSGSNNVTVLLGGSGPGLSGTSFNVPTGAAPSSVAIADVNSDGLADLVTANQNGGTFSVLRGTAAGSFLAKVDFAVGASPWVATVGDWNGDGAVDVATANFAASTVSVRYGDGLGGFSAADTYPTVVHPVVVVPGDVTGDGLVDLVVGTRDVTQFQVLAASGTGTFLGQTIATGFAISGSVSVGDIDGDGARDVVTLYPARAEIEFNGLALVGARTPHSTATKPSRIDAGDVDGDGDDDLAVACQGGSISLLYDDGDGGFPQRTDLPLPFAASVVLRDLGSDGLPEVVASAFRADGPSDSNRVAVYPNAGGSFGARVDLDIGLDHRQGVSAGDLNGDLHGDIVSLHYEEGVVRVFFGNGANGFTTGPSLTVPYPNGVRLADLDGNSALDLVVSQAGTKVSVFLGDGAGSFAPRVDYTVPQFSSQPAIGDIDRDGKLDLAVTGLTGILSILYGAANGTFEPKVDVSAGPLGAAISACLPDLNDDGFLDLVYAAGVDVVGIRMGQGNRTFGPPIGLPGGFEPDFIFAGDFDRNGTDDVAVTNYSPNEVSVFLGLARTRTTLVASPSPSAANAPLTLTATVDSSEATGLVRFYDGFTPIAQAPLQQGVAQVTLPASLLWDRSLRAEYVGDKRFHASLSPAVPHLTYVPSVGAPEAGIGTLALAPVGNPVRAGGPLRVRLALAGPETGHLALLDIRGRVLASRSVAGNGVVELAPASPLAPGVYLVRLQQAGRSAVARAVVF